MKGSAVISNKGKKSQEGSATLREQQKTLEERAQDIAYTVNHALLCFSNDTWINTIVAALSQKYLGKKLNTSLCMLSHRHDDGKQVCTNTDPDHVREHKEAREAVQETVGKSTSFSFGSGFDGIGSTSTDTSDAAKPKTPTVNIADAISCGTGCDHDHDTFLGAMKHWFVAEALGDLGGVGLTIALQRHAPDFMDWLSKGMEKVVGPLYARSTQAAAKDWAYRTGFGLTSPVTQRYQDELYQYEVKHLGQAVVWTVTSVGINLVSQKKLTGNNATVMELLLLKSAASGIVSGLLIGGRAFFPEQSSEWDKWNSDHIITPTSKVIASMSGMDQQQLDAALKHKDTLGSEAWISKVMAEMDDTGVPTWRLPAR